MAMILSRRRDETKAQSMAARRALGKLARDTRGATAVEYGFVVTLVVIAIIVSLTSFGGANLDIWTNVSAKVRAAG